MHQVCSLAMCQAMPEFLLLFQLSNFAINFDYLSPFCLLPIRPVAVLFVADPTCRRFYLYPSPVTSSLRRTFGGVRLYECFA